MKQRKLSVFLLATAVLSLSASALAALPPPVKSVPGEVVVGFKQGHTGFAPILHAAAGAQIKTEVPQINAQLVKLPANMSIQQAISFYQSNFAVAYAAPNYIHQKRATPNDPRFPNQYGAFQMRLPQAWDINKGNAGVVVAIIDDGVDISHPDLSANIAHGKDFVDGDNDPTPPPGDDHGTHVAGISGATTNNAIGVAGMGWNCRLMGIRFNYTTVQSAQSMIYAADNGAKVANMSYGYYGPQNPVERDAVNYAWNKGVLLVGAAGNINTNTLDSYPDGYTNVVSVGSTGPSGTKSGFSDWGPRVDVAAPGENIISTVPNNGYANFSGTSMSSPGVCGVAGLLFAHGGPTVTNAEVRAAIENTCVFIGTWLQKGRVDAEAALGQIRPTVPVDVVPTTVTLYEGAHISGGAAQIAHSDNTYYTLMTVGVGKLGQAGGAIVEFDIPFSPNDLRDSTISFEAAGTIQSTTFMYLWNGSSWVSFRQFPLSSADSTMNVVMGSTLKDWIVGGKVKILLRAVKNLRLGPSASFPYKLDRVRIIAKVQA
jgi:thermitase